MALLRTLGVVCILGMAGLPASAADTYSAESVKAAYVYRFAGYVRWPDKSLPPDTFAIAVLGADEIAEQLRAMTAGRSLLNRPVHVRKVSRIKEADGAQILYVGADWRGSLQSQLSRFAERPVLIITDQHGGLAAGSTINLMVVDQRVRFEISLPAARRAGLEISSDLLSLAVRVHE